MDIPALIEQLAAEKEEVRRVAQRALVERGRDAVGPVLATLCDEDSPVDWAVSATVLRATGDAAFGPLAEAIATAPTAEVARRCGWAFSGLRVSNPEMYLPALRHPHPKVRGGAAYVLQNRGAAALPYAPQLIPLLADPDKDVRQRAMYALQEIGPEVMPLLRTVRRAKTDGKLRRPALTALAAVGGPDAFDAADQALVKRLIRIKIANETPQPMHLCGPWYALPTRDQHAVLDAFDLSDAVPATMRLGESAWNHDHHDWTPLNAHTRCSRMYVTPVLSGWTLVFGTPFDQVHSPGDTISPQQDSEISEAESSAAARRRCIALSRRFGAAHWYGMSCGDGWTAWCIAEHGHIRRYYDVFEPGDQIGPRHPAEGGYLLPHEDGFPEDAFDDGHDAFQASCRQPEDDPKTPDDCYATDIAARISVDPEALGPHTPVDGHGVLALTACGRRHGHPRGALHI